MNLPNQLTLARIGLAFLLIFFILTPGFGAKLAAVIIFALASLTDLWDGRLARKQGLVTSFGKLMDPIADKILVLSAFLAFVQLNVVPAWMVVAIATREFVITGVRLSALGRGQVLPAETAGKHKTVAQIAAISVVLLYLLAYETPQAQIGEWPWLAAGQVWIWWLMMITVVLTITSGLSFFWRHRDFIFDF